MRAKKADWDSDVFGVDVGILSQWHPEWSVEDVREANREDFDVVFVKSSAWVDPPAGSVAVDHLYDMEAAVGLNNPSGISVVEGPPPKGVLDVADTAFVDSRFLRDPRLALRAGAFYRKWVTDANGRLLVLEEAVSDAFLVEGRDPDESGRIELVGVGRTRRGRGLGTRLVHGAITRLGAPVVWRVRTSCRNWKAVRFYERLGFMVRGVSTAFHIWVNI